METLATGWEYYLCRRRLTALSGKEGLMYSLLRQRIVLCRVHVALLVLVCGQCLFSHAQTSTAAAFANPDASRNAAVPPVARPAPASPPVALSPEQLGDLMLARGNYLAAVRAYQQTPLTSAVVWDKIGVAYHHMFALDQAQKAYESALAINPRYPSALNNLAAVYYGKREYKRAERTYKRALKYQPNVAITYSNLGTSYFAQGKYKQGRKAYQTAFRLDPNVFNPDSSSRVDEASPRQQLRAIHYYLARTYASAGKKNAALEYLRQAFGEGFNDRKRLLADKDFDPIRSSPEFQQLLLEQHLD